MKSLDAKAIDDAVLDAFFEILLHRVATNCPLTKITDRGSADDDPSPSATVVANVVICAEELKEPVDMLKVREF